MSLLNEKTSSVTRTVTTYDRAYLTTIDSPNGLPPTITYVKETVQREEGQPDVSIGEAGSTSETLTPENQNTVFTLYNPVDHSAIGSMTYAELQAAVYSLFFHLEGE